MVEEADGPFVYRYSPGPDALLPRYAKEALEGERRVLMSLFGEAPEQPVIVEFFPDESSFVAASGLPSEWVRTTGTVAISKWDRLLVLSPRTMARGYAWKDTLAHEYVHLALARASQNHAPVWFHEGSAKLLESAWRDPIRRDFVGPWAESLLARAIAEDSLVAFASMHPSMAALPSSELATLAFAQVAWAVDFVFDEVGDEGYRRVVTETARHGDLMRALDSVLGPSGRNFERSYRGHLDKQGLRVRAEVAEIDLEIESAGAIRPDGEGEKLDPILVKHRPMQDHARIGDMLRTRGHLRAALLEYERAEAAGPFHSPALANKTARALVGLGNGARALAVLRESVALYPEFTPTVALLAELYSGAGDRAAAIAMGERALGLNPFDPSVHRLLAKAYTESGLLEKRDGELWALKILGAENHPIGVK
jgi:tetratricopeptide (TPR) repeat protein